MFSCKSKETRYVIDKEDLYAWCIVPYDAKERSPEERIALLKTLGFKNYAYDWRVRHLEGTAEELRLAKREGIEPFAIWMWVDGKADKLDTLRWANQHMFEILTEVEYNGQIWMAFNDNFFVGLTEENSVHKASKFVKYMSRKAEKINCKLALYNHGDWFGDPRNVMEIIDALPEENLGLIYNFHHAYGHTDDFSTFVDDMIPYVWAINLSGVRKDETQILGIGKGDYEIDMLCQIIDAAYTGKFGILGHIEDEDVRLVLQRNLEGLKEAITVQ